MTFLNIEKIGLVADYSMKGDWAFELAFYLARTHSLQLNIFNFLESPFSVSQTMKPSEIRIDSQLLESRELIQKDRHLREYYDDLLADYLDVGFKICLSARHNLELRRCLREKDYQLLIIPYKDRGISFGNMSIEEFAYRFIAPVILVGPDQPNQYFLNNPARLIADSLRLPFPHLNTVEKPIHFQKLPVV